MTFFIALFVLLMQFVWLYVDDMIGKGLDWIIIVKFLFYASFTLVPMALPLAVLLASLMTFGALGEKYELVAIKSVGVSIGKIMRPLIILSIFISIFAFYFNNNILPVAALKHRVLLWNIQKKKLSLNFQDGVFDNSVGDFIIRIGKKEEDGQRIKDVMIYDHSKKGENVSVTRADSGKMMIAPNGQELIFILYHGESYIESVDKKDYHKTHEFKHVKFDMQYKRFDLKDFAMGNTNEEIFKNHYRMYDLSLLKIRTDSLIKGMDNREKNYIKNIRNQFSFFQSVDSGRLAKYGTDTLYINKLLAVAPKSTLKKTFASAKKKLEYQYNDLKNLSESIESKRMFIRKHQAEWHRKFTLSIAVLILFFVGAPLGAIIRKGGFGYPLVIAVFVFVVYYIISTTGEKAVVKGVLDPNIGMWLSSIILLPLGVYLTYIATIDASVMDKEAWEKIFGKINAFIKRKNK